MPILTVLPAGILNFLSERGRPVQCHTPGGRRSSRPRLEVLEDRTLLSTDIVSNTNDSGKGSLRATISSASSGDTIEFASGVTGEIVLSGALAITQNLDIEGPGAGILTISGGHFYQVFNVEQNLTVTIAGVTIANGNSDTGGGIYNRGTLTLTNCALAGNSAEYAGGAITNEGTLTMTNCTISGNSVESFGAGGMYSGGGIFSGGKLTVADCTISGNSATDDGGGIAGNGNVTVTNSTLSGNSASDGGAISVGGSVTLANTIIAPKTATNGADVDGAVTSLGYNLIGDSSGASGFAATDLLNVDPLLGPLQNNGGPTETMALLPGSPAIAAGSVGLIPSGITTDQRGFPRIVNGFVDIGAFEVQVYTVLSTADSGGGTLRFALTQADQFGGGLIDITASGLIGLMSPLPTIGSAVEILGPGASNLTISGNEASAVFGVNSGATAAIAGLTIADGRSAIGAGIENLGTLTVSSCTLSGNSSSFYAGAIYNNGTLTVTSSTLAGNSASSGGGIFNKGTLTLTNSTLAGNSADDGGGIYIDGGTLTVTNSTLAENSASFRGGGIADFGGTVTLANTIVATNAAKTGADVYGTVTSKGFNLIGNSSGASGFTAADLLNLNPLLGPLQNNGGPTETMALLSGSPAIATGNVNRIPAGITTDQRGSARVVNGTVDIGAFESRLKPSAPTIILEQVVTKQKTNKKGKPVAKPVFVGFAFDFSTAMDRSTAGLKADYQVERTVNKRVMKKVKFVAAYNQSTNSVTLTLRGKPTFPKGGQITVIASAPKGVRSTAGVLLDSSDTVFTIQAKAKGIAPG